MGWLTNESASPFQFMKPLKLLLLSILMLPATFAERGGPNNEYILVKTNEASRWVSQSGALPFQYWDGGGGMQVQILTNGPLFDIGGTNGSDGTCVWTPLRHEVVVVYDLKKVGDNDPVGPFSLPATKNISVLVKNYRQGVPEVGEKNTPSRDDLRPVIYVESAAGINSPADGWYFLVNNLHQNTTSTNWELLVFSNVLSNGHPNNAWVSRLDQKNLVIASVPSKTNSFFRFERFWLGGMGVNSNAAETTTIYSFTGGTISAVGFAAIGLRGSVTNTHWHQISGTIKIDEIRLY